MSNKRLATNLTANIFSFFIGASITFILTPWLVLHIGKEAYGFYPLANNIIVYINLLVIPLNSMAARFIMVEVIKNNIEKTNEYFNSVIIGNVIIIVVLCIPALLFVANIKYFLTVPEDLLLDIQLLFSSIILTFFVTMVGGVFNISTLAVNRIDLRSYQEIIQNISKAILFVFFFTFLRPFIWYVGVVNLIVSVLGLFIAVYFTKKLIPQIVLTYKYFKIKAVTQLLGSGIWNSFTQLSIVLLTGLDLILANLFFGVTAAGSYAIAQTIPLFISSFITIVVGVFMPRLAYNYSNSNIEGIVSEVKFSGKILTVLVGLPIAGFIIFGEAFYSLWLPMEDSRDLWLISSIIFAPFLVSAPINVLFNVNTVLNKVKIPAIVLFITGILNIGMVLTLINYTNLGLLSLPISSSLLAIARNLIFTPVYTARCLNVKWQTFYNLIFKGIINTVMIVIFYWIVDRFIVINSWASFVMTCLICGFTGVLFSLYITLDKKEKNNLMNYFYGKIGKGV